MPLFRRGLRRASFRDHRAFGHHGRRARNRIGQVEVLDRRHERRAAWPPPAPAIARTSAGLPGSIRSMRCRCGCASNSARRNCASKSYGSRCPSTSDSARRIAQSSRASPGGNDARARHLHAALGVDVDAGFFRIGRTRQDHVGAMRAAVAVAADIDDEGAGLDVDLVGAQEEDDIERVRRAPCRPRSGRPARARSRCRDRRHARLPCAGPKIRSSPHRWPCPSRPPGLQGLARRPPPRAAEHPARRSPTAAWPWREPRRSPCRSRPRPAFQGPHQGTGSRTSDRRARRSDRWGTRPRASACGCERSGPRPPGAGWSRRSAAHPPFRYRGSWR